MSRNSVRRLAMAIIIMSAAATLLTAPQAQASPRACGKEVFVKAWSIRACAYAALGKQFLEYDLFNNSDQSRSLTIKVKTGRKSAGGVWVWGTWGYPSERVKPRSKTTTYVMPGQNDDCTGLRVTFRGLNDYSQATVCQHW